MTAVPSAHPSPLARLGADPDTEAALARAATEHADADAPEPGRVARLERGRATVLTAAALTAAPGAWCGAALPRLAVGDWVVVGRDRVLAALPRHTAFVRAASTRRTQPQVLVVGVDVALVCAAADQPLRLTRVERFLALAWEAGARPVVVVTKSDALPEAELGTAQVDLARAAPGVSVIAVSTRTGQGMPALQRLCGPGITLAVLGPSGVGKSSLVNGLVGDDVLPVGATRASDGKGRHTTVRRELVVLPSGGAIIETPGLRGLALWDATDGLERAFSDVADLAADCRFRDCAHRTEPGCAVIAAVDAGVLDARRVSSHAHLARELERLAARQHARRRRSG